MKYFAFLLIFLFSTSINSYCQAKAVYSMDNTFSSGNNGGWTGNISTDVVKSINATDGIMNVAVNKVAAPWSVLGMFISSCMFDGWVFDQTNRFMEFRVKCNVAQTTPMNFSLKWGGCDGCCPEDKTFPSISFTIPKADVWTTVYRKIPQSTGGSQNVIDSLKWWLAFSLANGNYSFDYIKIGQAAKPPVPKMDSVRTKTVNENAGVQTVILSNISLPGRFIDDLTIKAEALSDSVIKDVHVLISTFTLDNITNNAEAALQYTPVEGMGGSGDSIIVTLTDTIRGTTARTSFYVKLLACPCVGLDEISGDISVYPTSVVDFVNIDFKEEFAGEITVVDMLGNIVALQKIAGTSSKINLSAFAPGLYIVKISDGKNTFNKKLIKQ